MHCSCDISWDALLIEDDVTDVGFPEPRTMLTQHYPEPLLRPGAR